MHLGIYKKWLGSFVSGTVARDEDEQYACVLFLGGGLNAIPSPITLNLLSTYNTTHAMQGVKHTYACMYVDYRY